MKTIADAAERIVSQAYFVHGNIPALNSFVTAELAAIVEERDARIRQLEDQLAAAKDRIAAATLVLTTPSTAEQLARASKCNGRPPGLPPEDEENPFHQEPAHD